MSIKWIRPSGTEIETNERKETIEYAVSLGWKVAEDVNDTDVADIDQATDSEPEIAAEKEPSVEPEQKPAPKKRQTRRKAA